MTANRWPEGETTRERNARWRVGFIGSGDSHSIRVRMALAEEVARAFRVRERAKRLAAQASLNNQGLAFEREAEAARQTMAALRRVAKETR